MGAVIPAKILGLEGQVIKDVVFNETSGRVRIVCDRDRRRRPVDDRTGRRRQVHRLLRRTVLDVPIGGHPCEVEIAYAETFLSPGHVRVEQLPFVCPKARVTTRYARLIAGMARHMPISAVARHTGLSWDTVKAIECAYLAQTIPIPRPQTLTGIRYLGVDEVARAKGQSYFTLVYDLSPGAQYGRILRVNEGREAAVLLEFLDALSAECAAGIAAVALDMGPACIAAVRESLPQAAIVFDRFHVMRMFNKVIRDWTFHFSDGHTPGQLLPEVDMPAGPVMFGGDLIPGAPWVHLPITMGHDRFREMLIDERSQVLESLLGRNGRIVFTHDPSVALGRLSKDAKGKFVLSESSSDVAGLAS